ncbi:Hypothetical predicted protein [Cloeon dipterum]|nr:Hypothetical predicted protein [Cloeon dipterum]
MPQFDQNFTIPSCPMGGPPFRPEPRFRSPMADVEYDGPPGERKKRFPYRGPAPHRNPAPGPLGLTGPWQNMGGAPPVPNFRNNNRRGSFRGRAPGPLRPPPHFTNGGPPHGNFHPPPAPFVKDFPKFKKASPYNMTVNPTGKVDVAAAKQKLLETVLDKKYVGLPKELLDMFSPLKCDLCNAKMNSNAMAKLHYSGKTHEKKVRQFMSNHCEGAPPAAPAAKKPKLSEEEKPILITAKMQLDEEEASAPATEDAASQQNEKTATAVIQSQKMECVHCNVSFVNPNQATQHFMSRNHSRKMRGLDPPKNAKYYNPNTCEWQAKPMALPAEDLTGRFGIGSEFSRPLDSPPFVSSTSKAPPDKSLKVYCDVCDCFTTSEEQMQNHLKGSRHQKKWAAKQKAQANLPQGIFLEEAAPKEPSINAVIKELKQVGKKAAAATDMSNYRTPSGNYYCSICNLSVNSESQFKSHSDSKKHKAKLAGGKPSPSGKNGSAKWEAPPALEEKTSNSSFGLIPADDELSRN